MEDNNKGVSSSNRKLIDNLSIITRGMSDKLSGPATDILNKNLADLENKIDSFNSVSNVRNNDEKSILSKTMSSLNDDKLRSELPDIDADLNAIRNYYERYYTTLKDYETIPSLVPQIIRVLKFLCNEVVSPDVHNKKTFAINCDSEVYDEIEKIIDDHKLYAELPKIVEKRFRLGKVYYLVQGYATLFDLVGSMKPDQMNLNESIVFSYIKDKFDSFLTTHKIGGKITVPVLNETGTYETNEEFDISKMNIKIEYGGSIRDYSAQYKAINASLNETAKYSVKNIIKGKSRPNISFNEFMLAESIALNGKAKLNESFTRDVDKKKIIDLAKALKDKDNLRRCTIVELDPGRVFPLKTSNRILGYFYYEEDKLDDQLISFNDLISKHLKKGKIGKDALKVAEEKVTNKVSRFILDNIKENLDIDDINDIDLFVDFLINSEVGKGNRTYRFYHVDDIIDISRSDGSLLINSVYQAKLLAILMHNNIVTKLTKGRDREIFTVNMGASTSVAPYLNHAMEVIASGNDGVYRALNGPIAKILNPYQNSTIIIPTESGVEEYIKADIIQGQDVDMDLDIIKFLLNNIITSYGVDPGIVDLLNQSVDFAKSLTMINKEMLILNINEQADLLPGFKDLILNVLYEEGSDKIREHLSSDKIEVKLFEPKSLILDIVSNETNNAKSFAELLIDSHPILNSIQEEDEFTKRLAAYNLMQEFVSSNFGEYDNIIENAMGKEYSKSKPRIKMFNSMRAVDVIEEGEPTGMNDYQEEEEEQYGVDEGEGGMSEDEVFEEENPDENVEEETNDDEFFG